MQNNKILLIIFAVVVFLLTLLLAFLAIITLLYQKKQAYFAKQMEEAKISFERELLQTQLEVTKQTLEHISREIHDNINQHFTLAKLQLNTISLQQIDVAAEKVSFAAELLTKGMSDLRDLSQSLSLETIQSAGLEKAIDSQVVNLLRLGQFTVHYEVVGDYNYADEKTEIIIFRILQEAINNILRHSQAKTIIIVLDCTEANTIKLYIKDDGKGFTVKGKSLPGTHLPVGGLHHMSVRAHLINARFRIESVPGAGAEISLEVPINQEYETIE